MSYDWCPIYEELATTLLAYENRQGDLIHFLTALNDPKARKIPKFPALRIRDKTASGDATLTEIDPFSFFASFNHPQTDPNRRAGLTRLKEHFGLTAKVPIDFHGIPFSNRCSFWFFHYAVDRQPDEIPRLWALARQAVSGGRKAIDGATFDRCIRVETMNIRNMSMGLFWLRPREFMPLDRQSVAFLRANAVDVPETIDTWAAYASVLHGAVSTLGDDFSQLSLDAYKLEDAAPSPLVVAESAVRPPRS
jgi:5-methylcytosine-specific restriction protein B